MRIDEKEQFRGPVDKGPFDWDRTRDGKIDADLCLECDKEPQVNMGYCLKCRPISHEIMNRSGYIKINSMTEKCRQYISSLQSGMSFCIKDLMKTLGHEGERGRRIVSHAVRCLMVDGKVLKRGRGDWVVQ